MIPKAQTVKKAPKSTPPPIKKVEKKAGPAVPCCGARNGDKPTKG